MALKLMYITNDVEIAKIAERSGVDWIFVDLEINGKEQRQGHLDTVISRHNIEDVKRIKEVLITSKLLVRVNPIYEGSKNEIERVINDGANIVMLPMFTAAYEVERFVEMVDSKAEVMLLLETSEAVRNIDEILAVEGIDYIHIGLNDLHLSYKMVFMFDILANGLVDFICNKVKEKKISYGFGGISKLKTGVVPAENIIAEHYRIGSTMTILSRSFYNKYRFDSPEKIQREFDEGVNAIRDYEKILSFQNESFFEKNRVETVYKIEKVNRNSR